MKEIPKSFRSFEKLVEIMDILRSDKGCPWDREQDENTIINYFLEEVYEAVDAIESGDPQSVKEELGDVLMEVVFLTRIFKEKHEFTIHDVLECINQKMIRRHPHVFGPNKIESSARVVDKWNQQKKKEKDRESALDGMAAHLPSLLKAFQIGQRVALVGFDWKSPLDALGKVREELVELEQALEANNKEGITEEIGDLLFSLANISRQLDINPEIALRQTNAKFSKRFRYIETRFKERGEKIERVSLDEMDVLWEEAKKEMDHL